MESREATVKQLSSSELSSDLSVPERTHNGQRLRITVLKGEQQSVNLIWSHVKQLLCERRKMAKQQTLDVFFKQTPLKETNCSPAVLG